MALTGPPRRLIGVVAAHVIDLVPLIGLPAHDEWAGHAGLHQKRRVMGEWLEKWVAPLRDAGIPYRTVIAEGNPAGRLDEIATEEGAELIVVGRRGRGGLAEQLLGSVPHVLANHASCPVVVVPIEQFT